MFAIIAKDVTATFSATKLTGAIEWIPATHALTMRTPYGLSKRISTNFGPEGLNPRDDTTFIKDWSEHVGLAASLEAAGVVEIVRAVNVGPYKDRAYEVRVLVPSGARELAGVGA
ncbi:hypothetical protein ACFVU2_19150 [Leifsonia sp. NPDC058194]|uniref:hypothetical protein n=1 Tax=Leifsonia sp. NPDC058194 TaxID=3346374 RepID=UPI0036D7DBA6